MENDKQNLTNTLVKSTNDTKLIVSGMQNLIGNTVPKRILANESWLDKANLWLEGKATLVKVVTAIIVLLFPTLAGIGVTEMIADNTSTGLTGGGLLGAILTGTIFGRNAKKFDPMKDAIITIDGNVYLDESEIPTPQSTVTDSDPQDAEAVG